MDDWMEQLERLNELRKEGILTDAEFAAEKAALLPSAKPTPTQAQAPLPPQTQPATAASEPALTVQEVEDEHLRSDESISAAQTQSLILVLFLFGVFGFISMFLEWYPDYTPKALDSMVVISVAYYLLFPLLSIYLLFKAVGNRRKQAIAIGFMMPVFTFMISEVYAAVNILVITPLRAAADSYFTYGDIVGEYKAGFWMMLVVTIPAIIYMSRYVFNFLKGSFLPGDFFIGSPLWRSDSLVIIGAFLIALGNIYPQIKPSPYFSDDFTPFADTYKVNMEVWLQGGLIIPILLVVASVMIARLDNSSIRTAGMLGLLYVSVTSVFQVIAYNADTEYYACWSFGGTLTVIGMAVIALTLLKKFSGSLVAARFKDGESD